MQLIVLGMLPGTDIQLTFELLANVFAVFVILLLIRSYVYAYRRRTALNLKDYRLRTIGSRLGNLIPHSF